MALPQYSERRGWVGGSNRTLYAFTDKRTGAVSVHPGGGQGKKLLMHVGPAAKVRVATRAQAEAHWQKPLHPGWTTLGRSAQPFARLAVGAAAAARHGDCATARALASQMLYRAKTPKERTAVMRVQAKVRSCRVVLGRARRAPRGRR